MSDQRLTFKQARETLPQAVAQRAVEMARDYRVARITVRVQKHLYFAEDCTYYAFHARTGDWAAIRCGGEWFGGYHGTHDPINTATEMPIGAYVIEKQIFCGKPFVNVIHWNGIESLEG